MEYPHYIHFKSPMKTPNKNKLASAIAPITIKTNASEICVCPILNTLTTDQLKTALRDRKLPIPKLKSEMVKELDDCMAAVAAPVTITIA